jgi:hypothetical protein
MGGVMVVGLRLEITPSPHIKFAKYSIQTTYLQNPHSMMVSK